MLQRVENGQGLLPSWSPLRTSFAKMRTAKTLLLWPTVSNPSLSRMIALQLLSTRIDLSFFSHVFQLVKERDSQIVIE